MYKEPVIVIDSGGKFLVEEEVQKTHWYQNQTICSGVCANLCRICEGPEGRGSGDAHFGIIFNYHLSGRLPFLKKKTEDFFLVMESPYNYEKKQEILVSFLNFFEEVDKASKSAQLKKLTLIKKKL